jgi:hypothetical protein
MKLPKQHIKALGKEIIFREMEGIFDWIYLVRERPGSKFGVPLNEHNDMFSHP